MADREDLPLSVGLEETQPALIVDDAEPEFDVDLCANADLVIDPNELDPESLKHYFEHQQKMFEVKTSAGFAAVLIVTFIICLFVNMFGSISHQYTWRPEAWALDVLAPLIGAVLSKLGIDFTTYKWKDREAKRAGKNPRGIR